MRIRKKKGIAQKLVVVGLIRDGNGKVLMQQRDDGKFAAADDKWELPGGKVDFGESPIEALTREILEETGCTVSVGRLLQPVHNRIWDRADGIRVQAIVLCYECWYMGGTPQPEQGKTKAVAWKTPAEIAAMDTLDGIPAFMADAGL